MVREEHLKTLKAQLQEHQLEALKHLRSGSILWGGVGTGKTRVAIAYYILNEQPKNLFVITTAKKRESLDWPREAAPYAISTHEDSTISGLLTVDSWNNIHKYAGIKNCFFIFDEQRLVGKGAWVKAFLQIAQHNNWIMLSATPGDTWLDYVPVFIANGFYRNRTQFIKEHVVYSPFTKFPKVQRYLGTGKLIKQREKILVHMPYRTGTVRHAKTIHVDYDHEMWDRMMRTRWHPFENRPIRDITDLCMAMRRVVNSHTSRLEAVAERLSHFPRLIVFYNFNYELEALRRLQELTEVAEYNGHKHEEIPDSDTWVYLVQYAAGSEAWETQKTAAMLFYSLTYSYKQWEQAHGRIDRMNTPFTDLYFFVLRSRTMIDSAIWRSLQAKRNFNASDFEKNISLPMAKNEQQTLFPSRDFNV